MIIRKHINTNFLIELDHVILFGLLIPMVPNLMCLRI